MPQTKAVYEDLPEFVKIAEQLVKKYSSKFGGVDTSKMICKACNNKERSEKKRMWEIDVVKNPISCDFKSYTYCIKVYLTDWSSFSETQKALLVADALHAIPTDGDDKLVSFDVKGYSSMFNNFGIDFMDNPKVPNLLKDDVKLK